MQATIKKKSTSLKLLTLFLLVNVTQIHSQTQCDSSVSVCPKVFDRLIENNILMDKCKADSALLAEQKKNLEQQIKNKDENIKEYMAIISTDSLETSAMEKDRDKFKRLYESALKAVARFKGVCLVLLGVATAEGVVIYLVRD